MFDIGVMFVLAWIIFAWFFEIDLKLKDGENKKNLSQLSLGGIEPLKSFANQSIDEDQKQITDDIVQGKHESTTVSPFYQGQNKNENDPRPYDENSMSPEMLYILLCFIYQLQSAVNSKKRKMCDKRENSDPVLLCEKNESLADKKKISGHVGCDVFQKVEDEYSIVSTRVKCLKNQNTPSSSTHYTSNYDHFCSQGFPSLPSSLFTYSDEDIISNLFSSIDIVCNDIRFESLPGENIQKKHASHDRKRLKNIRLSPSIQAQSSSEECQNISLKEESVGVTVDLLNNQLDNSKEESSHSSRCTPIAMQLRINCTANIKAGNGKVDDTRQEETRSTCFQKSLHSSTSNSSQTQLKIIEPADVSLTNGCSGETLQRSMNNGNISDYIDEPLGIKFHLSKYPSYANLADRINSFTNWPPGMTQTPRDMGLAGFFYAGHGDYIRCFYCGGGLRNWDPGDDPWVEHARWFSTCSFVQQNRGQEFIDLVVKRAAEMEERKKQDEAGNVQTTCLTEKKTKSFCPPEKEAVLSKCKESVMKRKRKVRGKKRSTSKIKREKRIVQRILREIIKWQISLRRNPAVMYDFQTQNIYPSRTIGNMRLNQTSNEGLEGGGLHDAIVQSRPAEANPSNGEQLQNMLPNAGSGTFSRYESLTERNPQNRNLDANRAENNSVPTTIEGQSQKRNIEETSFKTSHSSVDPEEDGISMTSVLSRITSSSLLSSAEEDEAFRYEWIRLKTFSSWPLTSLFSSVMARSGWVAQGEGDKAKCYSCHVVHEGWKIGDNPLDFHGSHCSFIQSGSDNFPIIREDPTAQRRMELDQERIPNSNHVVPQGNVTQQVPRSEEENGNITMNLMFKDAGEPFKEERGNLVAMSSNPREITPNSELTESPPADNSSYTSRPPPQVVTPMESNPILKHSPSNPQGISAAGPPPLPHVREAQLEVLRRDPMGINFDRAKHPSYAILAVRISSFTDWPAAMTQTPRDMALAGFFYAGYGDYTRCFFCGGGLRNWEAGDDPWVEHARWFSKCAFVRQNRGQQFIDLVLRRAAEMEEQRPLDEAGNSQANTQLSDADQTLYKDEKIMKSAAVISIKDMGYSEETIKTAITTIKNRLPRGKHKVSAQEILEVIIELTDSQRASENFSSQSELQRNVYQSESASTPVVQSGFITENVTNNVSQSNFDAEKTEKLTNKEKITRSDSNTGDSGLGEYGIEPGDICTSNDLESLQRENTSLKGQITCKICMDEDVSIAFLPCGHLACCVDCAPAMRKCPICGELVKETLKAFLAKSNQIL